MSSDDADFYASFEPVPPGPRDHFWRVDGAVAVCTRCGISMRAVLTQLQAGYAPAPMLLVGSVAWNAIKHGRCAKGEA